jgi:hypothetical protein
MLSDSRANSVKHFQSLYSVVVAAALSVGVYEFGSVLSRNNLSFSQWHLWFNPALLLLTFIVTLIPFFHGNLRHWDALYIERHTRVYADYSMFLAESFFLFGESLLLIGLALTLRPDMITFHLVLLALLFACDAGWAKLSSHLNRGEIDPPGFTGSQRPSDEWRDKVMKVEEKWFWGNIWAFVVASCLAVLACVLSRPQMAALPELGVLFFLILLFCAIARTWYDYYSGEDLYFPKFDANVHVWR